MQRHCETIYPESLRKRPSRAGRYISVSLTVVATSRDQLDALYDDLTAHDKVLMRL